MAVFPSLTVLAAISLAFVSPQALLNTADDPPVSLTATTAATTAGIGIGTSADLLYAGKCSRKISDRIVIVDLAKWWQGGVLAGSDCDDCAQAPLRCSWLLKPLPTDSSELLQEQGEILILDSNVTTTTTTTTTTTKKRLKKNGTNGKKRSLQLSFVDFDISPIPSVLTPPALPEGEDEDEDEDEEGDGQQQVELVEDLDDFPPCFFNNLNVSYFDETTGERELIGQYCGDGWVPSVTTKAGRLVVVDVLLTKAFRAFKLRFSRAPYANETAMSQRVTTERDLPTCPSSYFQCHDESHRCIPQTFLCDAAVDCPQGSDESECSANEVLRTKQQAKAKSTDSGCGSPRYQSGTQGVFASADYPQQYPPNTRCVWYITTTPGTRIYLQFHQPFAIEPGSQALADECPFDALTFYSHRDQPDPKTELALSFLTRMCGFTPPGAVISPTNSLLITFESDASNGGAGFRLVWQAVTKQRAQMLMNVRGEPLKPTQPTLATTPEPLMEQLRPVACTNRNGAVLTSKYGTIRSPGFQVALYPRNLNCRWIIRPQLAAGKTLKSIDIRFYDFNVVESEKCRNDAVEIVYRDHGGVRHRGFYCDSNRPPIGEGLLAEAPSEVEIIFRTDSENQARGFELGYQVTTMVAESSTSKMNGFKAKPKTKPVLLTQHCGRSPFKAPAFTTGGMQMRVVGGDESQSGSWPFIAELNYMGNHVCAATIINERWLVTAAHCFKQGRRHRGGWNVIIGRQRWGAQVAWDGRSKVMTPAIDRIFVHKNNGRVSNPKAYDIALIRLAVNLDLQKSFLTAACMPSHNTNRADRCFVVGYGETKGRGQTGALNQAHVPIMETTSCKRLSTYYATLVRDDMICAGYEQGGVDSCQGDSGGPLACYVNGKWELHGIVSFGKGCAGARAPGVYTRVHSYVQWIGKVINGLDRKP